MLQMQKLIFQKTVSRDDLAGIGIPVVFNPISKPCGQ